MCLVYSSRLANDVRRSHRLWRHVNAIHLCCQVSESKRDQEEGGELDSHEEVSPEEIKSREVELGLRVGLLLLHFAVLAAVHGSLGLPGWRLFRGFTLLSPIFHSPRL